MIAIQLWKQEVHLRTFHFDDETITVGRAITSTLPIRDDSLLPVHLRIIRKRSGYFLHPGCDEDPEIYVNGSRFSEMERLLREGDRIAAGQFVLIVSYPPTDDDSNAGRPLEIEDDETILMDFLPAVWESGDIDPRDEDSTALLHTRGGARLLAIHGPITGSSFPLSGSIKIGRSPTLNMIVLEDERVSRVHCTIRYRMGNFHLYDTHSINRTRVNGKELEVDRDHRLRGDDEIEIGNTIFRFLPGNACNIAPPRRCGSLIARIGWNFRSLLFMLTLLGAIISGCVYLMTDIAGRGEKEPVTVDFVAQIDLFEDEVASRRPVSLLLGDTDGKKGFELVYQSSLGELACYSLEVQDLLWRSNVNASDTTHSPRLISLPGTEKRALLTVAPGPRLQLVDGKDGIVLHRSPFIEGEIRFVSCVVPRAGETLRFVVVDSDDKLILGSFPQKESFWREVQLPAPLCHPPCVFVMSDGWIAYLLTTEAMLILHPTGELKRAFSLPVGWQREDIAGSDRCCPFNAAIRSGDDLLFLARQDNTFATFHLDDGSLIAEGNLFDFQDVASRSVYCTSLRPGEPVAIGRTTGGNLVVHPLAAENPDRGIYRQSSRETSGTISPEVVTTGLPADIISPPILADLDEDGLAEILTTKAGRPVMIDPSLPDPFNYPIYLPIVVDTSLIFSKTLIADINFDRHPELLIPDRKNRVSIYRLNTRVSRGSILRGSDGIVENHRHVEEKIAIMPGSGPGTLLLCGLAALTGAIQAFTSHRRRGKLP